MTQYNNNFNNGYNQQPQGGYNQQPQGGYNQQPQGGYNQRPQGGNDGQQRNNSGFDNFAEMTVIGRIVNDPKSEEKGNGKVATAKLAINHMSEKDGTDFWFIEIWGNENSDSKHNFLVNHCPKGRRVFIKGVPTLRMQTKDLGNGQKEYNYFPTIKILDIRGLDGGGKEGNNNNSQNNQPPTGQYGGAPQGNQYPPAPQGGNQFPPAPNQGGYPPAPNQPQGGFPPAPPAPNGAPGAFPPNVPGAGYGAPVGVAPGAPNANGGFPQ